jgi:DNA-binding NarL/FixJ family response regulator
VAADGREDVIRVMIVDDHALFRHGLRSVLEADAGISVVAEAGSCADLAAVDPAGCDIVLLDVALPDGSGLDELPRILTAAPDTRVVMLTVSDDHHDLYRAVQAGAVGYLLKDLALDAVVDSVRVAAAGDSSFSPQMASKLVAGFNHMADMAAKEAGPTRLTRREREVLTHVAKGWSNRRIADELHLSENTVKNHLRNVCEKLDAHTRTEAVTRAVREGWITLD